MVLYSDSQLMISQPCAVHFFFLLFLFFFFFLIFSPLDSTFRDDDVLNSGLMRGIVKYITRQRKDTGQTLLIPHCNLGKLFHYESSRLSMARCCLQQQWDLRSQLFNPRERTCSLQPPCNMQQLKVTYRQRQCRGR